MLTLFYAPRSCALASLVALEEAGASFELRRVDLAKAEQQSKEYLAVNPKGRVPVLATERGFLTETPAILAYIAQTHPEAKLAPVDDAFAFAELQAFNSYLCSTLHVAHAHKMRGSRWADDEAAFESMRRKVPQSVGACFDLIEQGMLRGPWVMGDAFTVADAYLFTVARWIEGDGVDPVRLPRVMDHRKRMMDRPAVAKALAQETAG